MDCGQNLSLPKDIAWKRIAFSPDMFDTDFFNPTLPKKWRSSVAAFYHMVPEEETKEQYPDRRIMYIKVSASITGYHPITDIDAETYQKENVLDDFQWSKLEKIIRLLMIYYPCMGAILQISVYPHREDLLLPHIGVWDYPFILDFEPKKREIYETVTKSGEVLSGSSSNINTKKGTTTTSSTEESDITTGYKGSIGIEGIFSASAEYTGEWGTREHQGRKVTDTRSVDSSREKRETQSHTTNITQMYQPLLSYHLGTNRALWMISPRPHTVDSEQNLISLSQYQYELEYGKPPSLEKVDIGRQLEGIQDVFIVVSLPKTIKSKDGKDIPYKGICFQATLDTGHEFLSFLPGQDRYNDLVVTRRTIQSCGKFDKNGNLKISGFPITEHTTHQMVINEEQNLPPVISIDSKEINDVKKKTELVFKANQRTQYIKKMILDGYSNPTYKPRHYVETENFKSLLIASLQESDYEIADLEKMSKKETSLLEKEGIKTVKDLLRISNEKEFLEKSSAETKGYVLKLRETLLRKTLDIPKQIVEFQKKKYKDEKIKSGKKKPTKKKK